MAFDPHATDIVSWAVGIPSIGVLIGYGISIIRRRASADTKAITEDREYHSMLESYKQERDEMKTDREQIVSRMLVLETERNDAITKVGKLTAEVEFLSGQVKDLKIMVDKLSTSLEQARQDIHTFIIDNSRLTTQVHYLESLVERRKISRDDNSVKP